MTLASINLVIGMSLGIYMGIQHDHTLAPVHAHLNLIGWVSLFIVGLFYKLHPNARGNLVYIQVATLIHGYPQFAGGLAGVFLIGEEFFFPIVVSGSVMLLFSMIMFSIVVWRNIKEDVKVKLVEP